jgi:hypothetical protein
MQGKLYVLLGDLIGSTKVIDRELFGKRLERACETVNTRYAKDLYGHLKILKGVDEVGAVLSTLPNTYSIISLISEDLRPRVMRFTLVFDHIDTALETKDVAKMDGPAFHRASHMMAALKKSKMLYDMAVGDPLLDTSITSEINLLLLLKQSWSDRQYKVVKEYEKTGNQLQVARTLGISQQAVSKTLSRSMWREIRNIQDKLTDVLRAYPHRLQ